MRIETEMASKVETWLIRTRLLGMWMFDQDISLNSLDSHSQTIRNTHTGTKASFEEHGCSQPSSGFVSMMRSCRTY